MAGKCLWKGHNRKDTSSPEGIRLYSYAFTAGPAASPSRRRRKSRSLFVATPSSHFTNSVVWQKVAPYSVATPPLLLPRMAFCADLPLQRPLKYEGFLRFSRLIFLLSDYNYYRLIYQGLFISKLSYQLEVGKKFGGLIWKNFGSSPN